MHGEGRFPPHMRDLLWEVSYEEVLCPFDVTLAPLVIVADVEYVDSRAIYGFFQLLDGTRLEPRDWFSAVPPLGHSVTETGSDVVKAKPIQIRLSHLGVPGSFRNERDLLFVS